MIEDEDFVESNLMHGINGYLYGNMPEIRMRVGDRVRWYMFSFGTEVDLHGVAWHGHTVVTSLGKRAASIFMAPSSFEVADMIPDVPGKWLVECHTHTITSMLACNIFTLSLSRRDRSVLRVTDNVLVASVSLHSHVIIVIVCFFLSALSNGFFLC